MNRSKARRALIIGVVGTFVLGACGDDDNASDSTTAATQAAAAPETDAPSVETGAPIVTDAPTDSVAVTSPPPTGDSALTISNSSFSSATATAGVEFTITNEDGFGHTVTDRDGAFDVQVSGGTSQTLTIDRPGDYEIFCRIHDSMSGTITVV